MKKKELEKSVDTLVCKGLIPVAYYECDIFIHKEKEDVVKVNKQPVSPFFKQYNLPRKESEKLISKIYELY
ncbi:hypothetical protein SAMN05421856_104385 [Chryseobacterium taichungense]|uniref:Uncharacterized protein n=1 Tax=Chryseobacterium taichungense TaxID=295069 RepID=A0A1H7ZN31_9FLAO|nr:hypothetical protein [Chryseobacterium taichungense]SEM59693.1 hypothetical protein SAMN05421856_104385 [Chryseobacterium taichungense]